MAYIEGAGAALPLNSDTLVKTLYSAASSDMIQIKSGTSQLEEWENRGDYHSMLQNVALTASLPKEVRMLSMIQLKNGVDKYWRKTASNAIVNTEKATIREKLLPASLELDHERLRQFNAIVIAKVARHDFPAQWPDLMKKLVDTVVEAFSQEIATEKLNRILVVVHQVVKELATVRLQRQKVPFQENAPHLFLALAHLYVRGVNKWKERLQQTSHAALDMDLMNEMSSSVWPLKILRRLFIAGFDYQHRNVKNAEFWNLSCESLSAFINITFGKDFNPNYRIAASQLVLQLGKLHVAMATTDTVSFALLPQTTALVRDYFDFAVSLRKTEIDNKDPQDDEMSFNKKFVLSALSLLRACWKLVFKRMQTLQTTKYHKSQYNDDPSRAVDLFNGDLLTKTFIDRLWQDILALFLYYSPADLQDVESDPETWDMEDQGKEAEYETNQRACAEKLFLDIVLEQKSVIIEPLSRKLNEVCSLETSDPLAKEAILAAAGIAAPMLAGRFDFNSLLTNVLVQELQKHGSEGQQMLRRRIAIVISQWAPVDIDYENFPLVYEIFSFLINHNIDLNSNLVRYTAGKRFSDVLNAVDMFSKQERRKLWNQNMENFLIEMVSLIKEANLIETQMALLHTVGLTVEEMETNELRIVDQLVSLLPDLWQKAENRWPMRQGIVNILIKLVESDLGENADKVRSVAFEIMRYTLDPKSDMRTYLLEEVLDLWDALVQSKRQDYSAQLDPSLSAFLPALLPLYELDVETIRKALSITVHYILLAPISILADTQVLMQTFVQLLDIRDADIVSRLRDLIGNLVAIASHLSTESAVDNLVATFIEAGISRRILRSIYENWERHQSTGPNTRDPPGDWKNEPAYFDILSRICLASTSGFLRVLAASANESGLEENVFVDRVLEEWFRQWNDRVGAPESAKLQCMALTKLLDTRNPWITGRLQQLMTMWTTLTLELQDGNNIDTSILQNGGEPLHGITNTAKVKDYLSQKDPVGHVAIRDYIKHLLTNFVTSCGGEKAFTDEWLVNVDKEVIQSFLALGIV